MLAATVAASRIKSRAAAANNDGEPIKECDFGDEIANTLSEMGVSSRLSRELRLPTAMQEEAGSRQDSYKRADFYLEGNREVEEDESLVVEIKFFRAGSRMKAALRQLGDYVRIKCCPGIVVALQKDFSVVFSHVVRP